MQREDRGTFTSLRWTKEGSYYYATYFMKYLLLFLATVLSSATAMGTVYERTIERIYTIDTQTLPGALDLELRYGDVVIESGARNLARFDIVLKKDATSLEEANRYFDAVMAEFTQEGSAIKGAVDFKGEQVEPKLAFTIGPDIQIRVQLPPNYLIEVRNTKGSTRIVDIEGNHQVKQTAGSITLENCKGDHSVFTTSAKVTLERSPGAHTVKSTAGAISVLESSGSINAECVGASIAVRRARINTVLKTISGTILVDDCPGKHDVQTVSGDILASMPGQSLGDYIFKTTSGDVELYLNTDFKATLQIDTVSGNVESLFPLDPLKVNRRSYAGPINGGGNALNVKTVSGNITLAEYEPE